jgi:uncharacterized protein YgbK (DUF1537 family)
MRQHPVTPMHEADLRRHLAHQTGLRVDSIELPRLHRRRGQSELTTGLAVGERLKHELASRLASGAESILFDGVEPHDVDETGCLLWDFARAHQQPLFAVGSSGLTYGLASAWRRDAATANCTTSRRLEPVDSLLVMSGSCSPVTERQIAHALRNGYEGIAIEGRTPEACVNEAIAALRRSGKVVVYSSLGPLPPGVPAHGDTLGHQVGAMLRQIITQTGVRRVVLAGGDTSSHAISQLGLYALTWSAATQPGAPLCRAHSDSPELDGLELVLKGGQVGTEDFFERVRRG